MKYFPYQLIATANGWGNATADEERAAQRRHDTATKAYARHLARLRGRLSAPAWRFFAHGVQEGGLHDATLLELAVGDHLESKGRTDYLSYRNRATSRVRLEFLNLEGSYTRIFDCRDVRRVRTDLFTCEPLSRNLGDLYAYEICAIDAKWLRLGFLFASGADIEIEFRSLVFKSRRHKRKSGRRDRQQSDRRNG